MNLVKILTVIRHCVTVLMLQDEHVVFKRNKVQILIVNLVDIGNATGLEGSSSQVLKLLTRNRRDEVEMVDVVKAVLEVLRNSP